MEFFSNTNFDFMRARRLFLVVSVVVLILSVMAVFVHQRLNIGIDFAGGTQLTIKFRNPPDIEVLRQALRADGIVESGIQRYGPPEDNEVMIKTPIMEGTEEGSRSLVEASLSRHLGNEIPGQLDLNRQGRDALAALLASVDPDQVRESEGDLAAQRHYDEVAGAAMAVRQSEGIIESIEQLRGLAGVSEAVYAVLESQTMAGEFAILAAENVGPQIGEELRIKGILAVLLSMVGMLAYIWWRFEFRFGIGAIAATFHDVMVCLGAYALADYEFNLTTVAAFLTVVGYSVNDTVVIFDRVRENLRRTRREPLVQVINTSLNQTLSRTVLTSGTTLIAVGTLFALGGEVIRGFAFVLLVGIVVGTYSSIYVASPVVLLWEHYFGRGARERRQQGRGQGDPSLAA